jgi:23S rRNA pseudouridine2605 synthase
MLTRGKPARPTRGPASTPRYGLARVMSKRGLCSRSQAVAMILAGRVRVNGRIEHDPERPTDAANDRIAIDGADAGPTVKVYLALNKPRGIVVSAADEKGRDTVYALLKDAGLPWLGPVGRLDKASEGLLLLTNDTVWAAGITEPDNELIKTYHVQVEGIPDVAALAAMQTGVVDAGEPLSAREARLLRSGEKNAWLEIVLNEGRNRQIRRLLSVLGFEVLRLVRVAIGGLPLGELPKGAWRVLTTEEVKALSLRQRGN